MRLIDAYKLWSDIQMLPHNGDIISSEEVEEAIMSAETIDPESLRPQGEWVPSESDFEDDDTLFDVEEWCDWQCTACHEDICYEDPMERRWLPKFCPNCGAKMKEAQP